MTGPHSSAHERVRPDASDQTMTELLLLSNSTAPGKRFLEHALDEIREALSSCRLLFIGFASSDPDAYTEVMRQALAVLEVEVLGAHESADPRRAIQEAEAIFVGGGNAFRLLRALDRLDALGALGSTVRAGTPYLGASAGANLACPTIRTTNDMPIVEPPTLCGLGLVPFQINPHYLDPDPGSTHQGETRTRRIEEFLEENDVPVLGMREGSWLHVSGRRIVLGGENGWRLFRCREEHLEVPSGTHLSWLLQWPARFDVTPVGHDQ